MQLRDVVSAVRLRFPGLSRDVVSDRMIGDAATQVQRALALAATRRNSSYLAQRLSIAFDVSTSNAPGTAGAGTPGGLPLSLDGTTVNVASASIGNAASYDLSTAVELVSEFVPTSSTTTTTTRTGAGWTVNAYATTLLQVVAGAGAGQVREITSNTATVLTHAAFATPLNSTSVVRVVATPAVNDETVNVVTGLPSYGESIGYLVRLNASGVPYLDTTRPIVAKYQQGIGLPPLDRILGGSVIASTAGRGRFVEMPLHLTHYQSRYAPHRWPAAYLLGNSLFLLGNSEDWNLVGSIDLRYVPIPPAFGATGSALDEFFLLPDTAYDAVVAGCAFRMAQAAAQRGTDVDLGLMKGEADAAAQNWLKSVGQGQGSAVRVTRRNR